MSENILESGKLYELWAWYEANRKRIHLWGAIIVAVGVSIAYFIWSAEQRAINANTALLKFGEPLEALVKDRLTADYLLGAAKEYEGTTAAERATLEAGAVYFKNGDYQKSLGVFEGFLKSHPVHPLTDVAKYGVAVNQDAMGKTEEALTTYLDLVTEGGTLASLAKINMAAIYEGNSQFDKALAIYKEIMSEPRQGWASTAYSRQREILAQHPELEEKPEAPASAASTPTAVKQPAASAAIPPMLAAPVEPPTAPVAPVATPAPAPVEKKADEVPAPAAPATPTPAETPAAPAPAK